MPKNALAGYRVHHSGGAFYARRGIIAGRDRKTARANYACPVSLNSLAVTTRLRPRCFAS